MSESYGQSSTIIADSCVYSIIILRIRHCFIRFFFFFGYRRCFLLFFFIIHTIPCLLFAHTVIVRILITVTDLRVSVRSAGFLDFWFSVCMCVLCFFFSSGAQIAGAFSTDLPLKDAKFRPGDAGSLLEFWFFLYTLLHWNCRKTRPHPPFRRANHGRTKYILNIYTYLCMYLTCKVLEWQKKNRL